MDARASPELRKPHPPSLSPRALALADWLHGHSNGALTAFFFAVTKLHSPGAIAGASAIGGL